MNTKYEEQAKALPQLRWKQDILRSFFKKQTSHSSIEVSYDTFLEQMAQRKMQKFCHLLLNVTEKDSHFKISMQKQVIWGETFDSSTEQFSFKTGSHL